MKYFRFLIPLLTFGIFFVSCTKEGQYTPKNKIDRIYYSSEYKEEVLTDVPGSTYWVTAEEGTTPKQVAEIWEWDGKLLKSISYYSDNYLDRMEEFVYDGKRLAAVTQGDFHVVLNYDKEGLASMDIYNEGTTRVGFYEFKHEKGKIVLMRVTEYYEANDYKGIVRQLPFSVFRFILPNADHRSLKKVMAHASESAKAKGVSVYTYDLKLEWDGDNISKVMYVAEGTTLATIQYTYDEKVNPFCGLFDFTRNDYEGYGYPDLLSKNNVTRVLWQYTDDPEIEEENYIYTYDKKLPTVRTISGSYTYNNGENRYSYTSSTYFEYK